jgi:hypothetical protein
MSACRAARWVALACLLVPWRTPAAASDVADVPLVRFLESLRRAGVAVIYSDALVRPGMSVRRLPQGAPRQQLDVVLADFGLQAVQGPGRSLLIVRAPRATSRVRPDGTGVADRAVALQEIVISASRYELLRQGSGQGHYLGAADIVRSPDVGDDPLRMLARLPGAAFSAFSAQAHFRGGAVSETLYRFDGVRLYEPFHLKDFQSVFSVIDPATLSGMVVHTGAYPARLGDRLSGVVELQPLHAHGAPQGEVSLSLFNVAALHARGLGSGRGALQLSARRSVYDQLLRWFDSSGSEPGYAEGLARARWQWNATVGVTAGVLAFSDDVKLADSDREEQARATYRDRYAWLRLEFAPPGRWSGSVALTDVALAADRSGEVVHPGVSSGTLLDRRRHAISGLNTDWAWGGRGVQVGFGAETRWVRGDYRYADAVAFDVLFDAPGFEAQRQRQRSLRLRPHGTLQAVYAETRLQPLPHLAAELGLRLDRETLSPGGSQRFSPRASVQWRASERLRWRAAVGLYSQGQGVEELRVSDGETRYPSPQRALQWVGGLEYDAQGRWRGQLEIYAKHYAHPHVRFENLLNSQVLLPELKPDRQRIVPQRAEARGIELTLERHVGDRLDAWLSAGWSSARERTATGWQSRAWDRPWSLAIGANATRGVWEASVALSARTGWPSTRLDLIEDEPAVARPAGRMGDVRLGGYLAMDLRVARHWRLREAGTLNAFVEAANVTGRRNTCCVEYEVNSDAGELDFETQRLAYPRPLASLGVAWRY